MNRLITKTLIKTLLVVFGMITTTTFALLGQTSTTGTVTVPGDVRYFDNTRAVEMNANHDFVIGTAQLSHNATVNLFQHDGTLVSSLMLENLNPGTSGSPGYAGNIIDRISYVDNVYVAGVIKFSISNKNIGIYRLDTLTNTLVHIRGFRNAEVTALHEYNGFLYAALAIGSNSHLGTDYLGDTGPSLVDFDASLGSMFQTVLLKLDPFGNVIGNPVHFKSVNSMLINEIKHDSNGNILVDVKEYISGAYEYSYHVLDGTNLADADQLPNTLMQTAAYPTAVDMIEDTETNTYIISAGNVMQKLDMQTGDTLVQNSGFTGHRLFIDGNHLVLTSNGSSTVINTMGKDYLEGRQAKQNTAVSGFEVQIMSSVNDTSMAYKIAENTPGTSTTVEFLEIVHDFVPPLVSTNVADGVLETFDYVEPNETDPLLMDTSDNHIGYMQFANTSTYTSIGIGNEVPSTWYNIPSGYVPAGGNGFFKQDPITNEYFFDVRVYKTAPNRLIYYRVYCTTDDIYQPEPELAPIAGSNPVITGMVGDGVVGMVNVTDPNTADILTYSAVGLPDGISIDATTGQYLGTYQVVGEFTATITATDQTGLFVEIAVTFIVSPASTISVAENVLNAITIYPNPVNNSLHIDNASEIINLRIYDAKGNIVFTAYNKAVNTIDVSHLPNGKYSTEIETNRGIVRKSFVKH